MSKKQLKKPWTDAHTKKYEWLYNYMSKHYDNMDKVNYIEINKRELMGVIEKNEN